MRSIYAGTLATLGLLACSAQAPERDAEPSASPTALPSAASASPEPSSAASATPEPSAATPTPEPSSAPSPTPEPTPNAVPVPAGVDDPRLACVRRHSAPPALVPVVRALCAELVDHEGVSASVAVAVGERLVWSAAEGPRCRGQAEPLRPTTALGIGSVTKLLTAVLALEVADPRGQSLDDPLALPGFSPSLTLRGLLTHTAGLRDPEPEALLAAGDDWPRVLAEQRAAPGAHAYANASFLLVGRWLEQTTGRTFADLHAHEPALGPLRERVSLSLSPSTPVACGHRWSDGWQAIDPADVPPLPAWTLAAGGGIASVEDLARLPAALARTGRLPAMIEARIPSDRPGWDYGLGVRVRGEGDDLVLAHSGNTGTYWAEVQWSPATGVAVAVMSTTPQPLVATLHAAFRAGQSTASPPSAAPPR